MSDNNREAERFTIRPAQPGDLCLLLVSANEAEIQTLRARQQALCTDLGGRPVALVHLTCQRFSGDVLHLSRLLRRLERATMEPLDIRAVGSEFLYSPFRGYHILKWHIEVSEALKQAMALIRRSIVAAGFQPLYAAGEVPSLVTALTDIPEPMQEIPDDVEGVSGHLFTGNRFILSRINGPEVYETLATFTFCESRFRQP